jgi:hypothetical protein
MAPTIEAPTSKPVQHSQSRMQYKSLALTRHATRCNLQFRSSPTLREILAGHGMVPCTILVDIAYPACVLSQQGAHIFPAKN